ncbi:MAG: ATPase [Betaproteobacteria bacterium]|nr:ATPase [Betaproteobacteria bacterium]
MTAKPRLGLGLDAGGTRTRWAIAAGRGEIVAEGHVRGMSALQVADARREQVARTLDELARDVLAIAKPDRVHAGLTGFGEGSERLADLIAAPLGLDPSAVTVGSDIETAYRDLFAPGEGYVVYAGTGSVAAYIDAAGTLHRAGGRGVTLDDGGGGFWIAREALRHVWRGEDERPGSWQDSPMAKALFERIGGTDWSFTRQYVYGGDRGDIGRLALAVAESADRDPVARRILEDAGRELARLGRAMIQRYGAKPVTLSGRASTLHPLIAETMRASLPGECPFALRPCHGHHAAARLALAAATA